MQFKWVGTILVYQPLGGIQTTNLPPFFNICPRYARYITPSVQEVKEAASLKAKCPVTAAS